jgi:leader peptidase (prepilin peptidase)/N-methyltransferase
VVAHFDLLISFWIFLFGMAVGSFLNVCIYRLPRKVSLTRPRSMCPGCRSKIAFYDNIPVLSYLLLRGRCRHCGSPISLRYPVVELVSGLFAIAVLSRYGVTLEALFLYGLISALLVVTFIDIDYQIIPDVITYPGIVIGFLMALIVGHLTWFESLLGILLGGGSLLLVAWGYSALTKREGMGGGDVKLLAMIGAFLGWQSVIFTIFAGSLIGTLAGATLAFRKGGGRKLAIPFGPFLSLGALLFLFFGPQILDWYFGMMR